MTYICAYFYFSPAGESQLSTNVPDSGAVQSNDTITMTCSVTYSGNWAPVIRWTDSQSNGNFPDNYITSTTTSTTVTSRLTVTASADLDGSRIVCDTYFAQPSSSLPTSATNVPSYTDSQNSPTIDIQGKWKLVEHFTDNKGKFTAAELDWTALQFSSVQFGSAAVNTPSQFSMCFLSTSNHSVNDNVSLSGG